MNHLFCDETINCLRNQDRYMELVVCFPPLVFPIIYFLFWPKCFINAIRCLRDMWKIINVYCIWLLFLNIVWFSRFCSTPPNSEIICGQNVGTKVVCGMILFFEKKAMLKIWKKSWVPFRSYLLNSTANPAQFECKWAGLAVLFSR